MNYFITKADFVGYVDLSQNIEDKYILPCIRMAQVINIRALLCENLYNQLYTEFSTNTLSYANSDLLDKVKEALIFFAYYRYLTTVSQIKSTPFGMAKKLSEDSEQATRREIGEMATLALADANYFAGEIKKHLDDNSDIFTLYRDSDCHCSKQDEDGMFNITSS